MYIASSNHILVITIVEPSNFSTAAGTIGLAPEGSTRMMAFTIIAH